MRVQKVFDFWVCLQLGAVRVFAKFCFNVGISILKNKKTTVWNKFPGGMQCARSGFYHGLGFLFQNWLVGTTIRQLLDPPKYVKPGSPKFWNCGTQIAMTVVAIFLWQWQFFFGHHDFWFQDCQRNLVKNWIFRSKVALVLNLFCNRFWQKSGARTCSKWVVRVFNFLVVAFSVWLFPHFDFDFALRNSNLHIFACCFMPPGTLF